MPESQFDRLDLKRALKEAMTEALQEQREFLHGVFAEVLEDFGLAEAIRDGLEKATRGEVFRILQGRPGTCSSGTCSSGRASRAT